MRAKRARYQQGSIRKVPRATGHVWEVRFSNITGGKRTRKTIIFPVNSEYPTEKAVRKAIQTQVTLANSDSERSKVAATFGAITELYRSEHLPTLKHSTQSTNKYLLKDYIEPRWAELRLEEVTPHRVLVWLGELRELAPTTKAAIRSIMSQCFHLAALHGYMQATERNPMALVRIKGTSKREKTIRILTEEQFRNLIDALPSPLNVMVLLTGVLGLRVGELLALHWEDFDLNTGTVTIQRNFTRQQIGSPKTDTSNAMLPLDEALVAILKAHRLTTKDSALVFPSPRNGSYRSAGMVMSKGIQPIAVKIGIGKISWHGLRHSCRTWLDAKGVPVGVQKDLLRHADVSTTMNRYGLALPDAMRTAQSKIVATLLPPSMTRPPKGSTN